MRILALIAAALAAGAPGLVIPDLDGRPLAPMRPAGAAHILFFVATDCPVSNAYAPEIQRTCREYEHRGVSCSLMYEDVGIDASAVRRHLQEYGFSGIRAAIDPAQAVASAAGASITPTAVLVDRNGGIRYRGRLDNLYATLGRTRRVITERYLRDALDAVLAGNPVRVTETPAIGCHIVPPGVRQHLHPSAHAAH